MENVTKAYREIFIFHLSCSFQESGFVILRFRRDLALRQ